MKYLLFFAFSTFLFFAGCKKECSCVENPNPSCVCDMSYEPVCGCNGKTYGNACEAECAGITDYEEGECH